MTKTTVRHTIRFTLNSEAMTAHVASHETLIERSRIASVSSARAEGCGQGLCGCCTVLVDRLAVSGCLYLAAFVNGTDVVTMGQPEAGEKLDEMQRHSLPAAPSNVESPRPALCSSPGNCSMSA